MNHVTINGKRYYQYETIIDRYPGVKYGRYRCNFIKHYHIPKTAIIYARDRDGWKETTGKPSRYDSLFIRRSWILANMDFHNVTPVMPKPIILDDSEMFKDDDGNIVDILVVGDRKSSSCYFYLNDVAEYFSMKHASKTLRSKKYALNKEYVYFDTKSSGIANIRSQKKRQIFLTYNGLLKLLYSVRKANVDKFRAWITDTIFTVHLGTSQQKKKLAGKLLGASTQAIKEVTKTFTRPLPSVYLFQLGTVEDLRVSMSIPDGFENNDLVVKYGYSKDLLRRTKEHVSISSYGGIEGSDIRLLYSTMIDPRYLSEAETSVGLYFYECDSLFSYGKCKELAIIPKKNLQFIKKYFEILGNSYALHINELTDQISRLQDTMQKELSIKDVKLAKKDARLARKESKIYKLKLRIAKMEKDRK